MRVTWKDYALWILLGAGIAAAGLVVAHVAGCADAQETLREIPQVVNAEHCWDDISFTIAGSATCPLAVARITELIRRSPECSAVMTGIGVQLVCHEDAPGDGGTDAH